MDTVMSRPVMMRQRRCNAPGSGVPHRFIKLKKSGRDI
nr:MAG TPA: hypothetical protein [Caudoviricetes sp.]